MLGLFRRYRRRQITAAPVPPAWTEWIERNVAVYRHLPASQAERLLKTTQIIVAERRFEGCKGLAITDEIKVTLAAQASLLLLGEDGYYFDRVTSFLLYPFKMILPEQHGLIAPEDPDERIIEGQAFKQGEIILSWPDVLSGGRDATDGENVVVHELAHHLDGLDGDMGGTPPGVPPADHDRWQRIVDQELLRLRRDLDDGRPTLLHAAAAENAAEIFAYGTELFFERPAELREQHRELFECYRSFYKVDPTAWFSSSTTAKAAPQRHVHRPVRHRVAPPRAMPPLATADQYFTRGLEAFEAGDYELASDDFNHCVRQAPDDQEALIYRSRTFLALGHLQAALADADRACRLDGQDLEAVAQRAICNSALGKYEQALADFERSTDGPVKDIDALFYRGLARARSGQAAKAIEDFTRVLELDPEDAEAWHERGQCHLELGRRDQAQHDLDRAGQLGWNEPQA